MPYIKWPNIYMKKIWKLQIFSSISQLVHVCLSSFIVGTSTQHRSQMHIQMHTHMHIALSTVSPVMLTYSSIFSSFQGDTKNTHALELLFGIHSEVFRK